MTTRPNHTSRPNTALIRATLFGTLFVAGWPSLAHAATGSDTVGSAIQYALSSTINAAAHLIILLAFLAGIYLLGSGLMLLYEASDQNRGTGMREGVLKLLAGSALCALPALLGISVETILNTAVYGGSTSAPIGAVQSCVSISGSIPMTCVLKNIASNVVPIATEAAFVICWVVALILLFNTVYGLAVSQGRGGSAAPQYWKLKLVAAGILANLPIFLEIIANTLGVHTGTVNASGFQGMSGGQVSSILAYAPSGVSGQLAQYTQEISYGFVIISMFGIFYALYGLALLMNPQSNKSKFDIAWHIIGGVALANPNYSVCLLVNTLMGSKFGFC